MLLSVDDAAAALGIGKRTLEQLIYDGKVTPVRIGRRVLVERRELDRFVEASRQPAATGDGSGRALAPVAEEKLSPKQRARFHANCEQLDDRLKTKRGTAKAALKDWAANRFGRDVASVNDLTYDEMSDVLDELRDRLEVAPPLAQTG